MNLRDLQDRIDRGEYPIDEQARQYIFNARDGTIISVEARSGQFITNAQPGKTRGEFPYLWINMVIAFAYGISSNGPLLTLLVSFLLFIVSLIVFTVIFTGYTYVNVRAAPPDAKIKKQEGSAALFVTILSATGAMVTVSIIIGQFPDITWWMTEFGIAYFLDSYMSNRLDRRITLSGRGSKKPPNRTPRDKGKRSKYLRNVLFSSRERIFFALAHVVITVLVLSQLLIVPVWLLILMLTYVIACLTIYAKNHLAGVRKSFPDATYLDVLSYTRYSFAALAPRKGELWFYPLFYGSLIVLVFSLLVLLILPFEDVLCRMLC
ncbi:MAG: hypothetical protein R3C14_11530 [Caldilineaceae bacterium]